MTVASLLASAKAAKGAAEAAALKAAGISPSTLSGISAPVSGFFSTTVPSIGRWFSNGLSLSPLATPGQKIGTWLIIIIPVLAITFGLLYKNGYFTPKPNSTKNAEAISAPLNALATKATPAAKKEGFKNPDEIFVNTQPPTIAHTGLISKDEFDADSAITNSLMSGFRSFVLQVDYMTVDKKGFPAVEEPTLLYRNGAGDLMSTNAGDLSGVAAALSTAAFSSSVPNYTQPILLYLHIVRAPSQITNPDKYKAFLSKIAKALKPLADKHLGMTALGDFHRQKLESSILTTPLSSLGGQVIILCNADTSVFRSETGGSKPAEDLDYWVNMRVYTDDSVKAPIGITMPAPPKQVAAATLTSLATVLNLSSAAADTFAINGKSRFVIAMPDAVTNPDPQEIDIALNNLGINMVPVDIFIEDPDTAKALFKQYDYLSWPSKGPALKSS